VLWETEEAWAAAHDDGFRALAQKPHWRDFPPIPAIFEVVSESYAQAA